MESNSDLSDISDLEFFSVGSDMVDDVEHTSYSSANETILNSMDTRMKKTQKISCNTMLSCPIFMFM